LVARTINCRECAATFHRVKVQMHWQRGAQSASRRSHPQGDNNAPANEAAYVWS